MIHSKEWTRRDFLRAAGVGAAAAVSPLIPLLSTEAAAQSSGLKRLVLVNSGNGTVLPNWRSNGAGTPFTSGGALPQLRGPILEPLEPFRDGLLILDGLDNAPCYLQGPERAKGHDGSSALWTGTAGGNGSDGGPAGGGFWPAHASVDQFINSKVGEGRRSLQLGVWSTPPLAQWVHSYNLNYTPLVPECDPGVAFDNVFRAGFGNTVASNPRARQRRESTILAVKAELSRLMLELPIEDRERLEEHLDGLNELENGLMTATDPTSCEVGAADRPQVDEPKSKPDQTLSAQIQVIAKAFACDQSRVASLTISNEGNWGHAHWLPEWTGPDAIRSSIHQVSHMMSSDPSPAARTRAVAQMTALSRWNAEVFAQLLGALRAHGVLEDTLVVWGAGLGHAGRHSNRNIPFVVYAGSAAAWRPGRYLRWGQYQIDEQCTSACNAFAGGETNNNLLVSICHAFDQPNTTFGDPQLCSPDGLDPWLV